MGLLRQHHIRARGFAAFGIALASLVIVPLAAAGVTTWAGMKTKVATACDNQELVQPFTQFGDSGSYTFAPNGGFENGKTGWALTGAASVVNGNESYFVHGTGDSKSLSLPAGATATSPAICFGTLYPWSRLFVNGPSGGSLKVDLLYVDDGGTGRSATLATLTGAGNWQLSSKLVAPSFLVSLFSKLGYTAPSGERFSAVAYRFTASGGTWKIDDLYVDPFKFR